MEPSPITAIPSSAHPPSGQLSSGRLILTIVLLVVLGSFCYANSLKNSLLQWDDHHYLMDNPYIHTISWPNIKAILTKPYFKNYSPLHILSYQIDYHFWKFRPEGYRMVNILLHLASTILIFLLIFEWYQTYSVALTTAAIFAVHTIHVESVVWISARKDVLSALFFFLSLYGYSRFSRFRDMRHRGRAQWSWYALSLAAACLALLSKPVTVMLPLILVLHELCFRREEKPFRWRAILPFFLLAALLAAVTYRAQSAEVMHYVGNSFALSVLLTGKILVLYLGKLLLPLGLSSRYVFPVSKLSDLFTLSSLLAAALLLLFLGGLVFLWRRNRSLAFPGCWFLITLAPVANLVPTSTQMADRYMYLPSVGYGLAIGLVAFAVSRRVRLRERGRRLLQTAIILAVAGMVVLYGSLTLTRNRVWRTDRTLWEDALAKDPGNYWAATFLANTYMTEAQKSRDAQEREKNLKQAKALFLQAIRQEPSFAQALLGMGSALLDEGNAQEAITYLWQARMWSNELDQSLRIEHNLGVAYIKTNQFRAAEEVFTSITRKDPAFVPAYFSLGKLYLCFGTSEGYQKAAEQYRRAIAVSPRDPQGYFYLGITQELLGDCSQALVNYREALRLAAEEASSASRMMVSPADIHLSLAGLYHRLQDYPKAIEHYREFLRLDPQNPRAEFVRSVILSLGG
ncbi:MAG: tetratricopeptide repeat protein [bacterium]